MSADQVDAVLDSDKTHCKCLYPTPLAPAGFCPACGTEGPMRQQVIQDLIAQGGRSIGDSGGHDLSLLQPTRTGHWLQIQTFPPVIYPVPGLLPEGFTILAGPPKAGKSWLTLGTLLAVSGAGLALGAIDCGPPRRVFYMALEDSDRRMQDRCRALLGGNGVIPNLFDYMTHLARPGAVLDTIRAQLYRHPDTALVWIDTLGKVMPPAGPGESAYSRDYRVGGELHALAQDHPGLAVVANHHDRKAVSEDFVDSVSGTNGLAGAADSIMVLQRRRQESDAILKVTGRDVTEGEYGICGIAVEGGLSWQLAGADLSEAARAVRDHAARARISDLSAQIIDFVNEHDGPVTNAEVKAKFGDNADVYLKRAFDSGLIGKSGRGKYQRLSEVSEVSESQVDDPELS